MTKAGRAESRPAVATRALAAGTAAGAPTTAEDVWHAHAGGASPSAAAVRPATARERPRAGHTAGPAAATAAVAVDEAALNAAAAALERDFAKCDALLSSRLCPLDVSC